MIEGYVVKKFEYPTKRYCQILDLKDDAVLIAEYKKAHSSHHIWQEVLDGIRSVGILEMEIYLKGNHLVMLLEAPTDFNWNIAMAKLSTLPRQAEWEVFVARFQQCVDNATSNEKWQMTERIFNLY